MIDVKQCLDDAEFERLLTSFSCPQNSDVESFLKNKALRFDLTHNARTYLILNEDDVDWGICAYFSISFKEIEIQQSCISKSTIKKLDGISKSALRIRAFLLGQIAKNSKANNPICLHDILEVIYAVLKDVQHTIGGRVLLLECEDNIKLVQLYEKHGFSILQKDDYVQMYQLFEPE